MSSRRPPKDTTNKKTLALMTAVIKVILGEVIRLIIAQPTLARGQTRSRCHHLVINLRPGKIRANNWEISARIFLLAFYRMTRGWS